ncbi:MAG: hypothetical protein NTX73_06930 [Rhodobacterales bacterium]|nr:hypothetical protein [Rhodobacterales bacterium]
MQMVMDGTAGLGLLIKLNTDRILYLVTILVSLGIGSWIGSLITQ